MLRLNIAIISILILVGCSSNKEFDLEELLRSDNIEDYFSIALSNPAHSSIDFVYDSITRKLIKYNISIVAAYYNETDPNNGTNHFIVESFDPYDHPGDIYERNAFEINISNPDTIFIESVPSTFENLNQKLNVFYDNPERLRNLSDQEFIELEILGEVQFSRGMIIIEGRIGRGEKREFVALEKYFDTFSIIEKYFIARRNNLANKYFSKDYDKLRTAEKEEICKLNSLYIWFIF